uniref:Uncharacterized protein n=1 Tax=Roseihalotalea indica TaxID=2867963 RepID=A0AA49GJG3_9BACT|nr:hypothetical protein K4G66_22535 [Tunicatimonas sp. TK19036]
MKITALAIPLFAVWLLACEEPNEEQINTLGTDVRVEMKEYLNEQQRTLMFKFFTTRDFSCINHRISYAYQQQVDGITIALKKVEEPDACLKAMGPASAFVDIGSLNIGEYDFKLKIGEEITNSGKLVVSPDSYQLMLNGDAGMNLETVELQRVPKEALWGTVQFLSQRNDNFAKSFVAQLGKLGATEDKFSEGEYGFFQVDASGKIAQPTLEENPPFTFLLNYNGDQDDVVSLLSEINRNYGDDVAIRLNMANGDEFRSWDLNN